jgi:O-antigen ligase
MSSRIHAAVAPFPSRDYERLWQVGVLAFAGLLGVFAAVQPRLAVAAILAAAFVPIVFAKPIIGLCAVLLFSFLESFSDLGSGFSVTKVVGFLLVLCWAAIAATALPEERARYALFGRQPALAAALVLFIAWAGVSLVWAEQPSAASDAVSRFALNFVLFPIALIAVRAPRHVVAVFAVFVAGALVAAVFGLVSPPAEGEGRLSGVGLNPNQLGQLLAVAFVLAAALATNRRWAGLLRLAALSAAVFAAIALYMTLSRGALVALAVALIVAPFAVGRGRRAGALVFVIVALVGTVGWFTAVAPESALQRITQPEAEGGSGREDLWRVGWRMVEDHPVRGVGAGNFPVTSVNYLFRPGATGHDKFIIDTPKVPHNIYLQVLAELGIVGLALFVMILVLSLRCILVAARKFAQRNEWLMETLARALFISLAGLLVAEFFSSQLFSKQLWLLLAMGPALLALAERSPRDERARIPQLTPLPSPARVRAGG